MTTTGDRIRRARLYRELSAEALAQRVGYATPSGIANLENRATGWDGDKLTQFAQALEVSVDTPAPSRARCAGAANFGAAP